MSWEIRPIPSPPSDEPLICEERPELAQSLAQYAGTSHEAFLALLRVRCELFEVADLLEWARVWVILLPEGDVGDNVRHFGSSVAERVARLHRALTQALELSARGSDEQLH